MIGATALRYVELNPVRARIVGQAEDHAWSSARSHLGLSPTPTWLDTEQFQKAKKCLALQILFLFT